MGRVADLRFLTDENIAPEVLEHLRSRGHDAVRVADRGLRGRPDSEVLAAAAAERRVVVTQDTDFGRLAVAERQPCEGIVLIRPGDLTPEEVVGLFEAMFQSAPVLPERFVLVLEPASIRVRSLV